MKAGISTASLFLKKNNEEVLPLFNEYKVDTAEVFFTSYCEYNDEFARLIEKGKGNVEINSVHVLTTQYEPQLYAGHPKVLNDAYSFLGDAMSAAKIIGAKYYTFHGLARIKRSSAYDSFPFYGKMTQKAFEYCRHYGVTLSYENVEWCLYNKPGIFKILKEYCPDLVGTLDIKQARISTYDYRDYIKDMSGCISHVHLSDIDSNGKMCLPGKGVFDFDELIERLKDAGFDGAMLIEVYNRDYDEIEELIHSYEFIKEKIYKHTR